MKIYCSSAVTLCASVSLNGPTRSLRGLLRRDGYWFQVIGLGSEILFVGYFLFVAYR